MERVKMILVAVPLSCVLPGHAAWRVVIDRKTTAAVAANAASQKLIEDRPNSRLDSINAKQQQLMKYTASMTSIKELCKLSIR
ncbi:hypothetical protein [Hallella multisaccharivorax]|uniref:hypothetical protein n=1 Tax=Hallella multisaccharivorax TaxID=310514 RepID=UPI003623C682